MDIRRILQCKMKEKLNKKENKMETKLHRWYRVNEDKLLVSLLVLTPFAGVYLLLKTVLWGWW